MKKDLRGSPKYLKNFHPNEFIKLSLNGKNITQIARNWEIDRGTIRKWGIRYPLFNIAIKKGKEYCEAWYIDLGQAAIVGKVIIDGKPIKFNLGAFVWMTKNVLKWSDGVKFGLKDIDDETLAAELRRRMDAVKTK